MEKRYEKLCKEKSDINEHLPVLKNYAEKCDIITEFGVRKGVSTCALLISNPKKFTCYDIKRRFPIEKYQEYAKNNNIDFNFIKKNVLNIEIEETDLLFIDTYHTYEQLKQELKLHGNKSRKYIIFHDVITFGNIGEDKKSPGLIKAIIEFLIENPEWSKKEWFENNNGLGILEKRKDINA